MKQCFVVCVHCVVIVFRISVTSPAMNVPVVCCQLLSSPLYIIFVTQSVRDTEYIRFLLTLYGIWNLDFFRSLIPQNSRICLPLNTMLWTMPGLPGGCLFLTCFYLLLREHDRGCRHVEIIPVVCSKTETRMEYQAFYYRCFCNISSSLTHKTAECILLLLMFTMQQVHYLVTFCSMMPQ